MEVSTSELKLALTEILYAGLVPYVSSSPGIGKSSITAQLADSLNLKLIDVRLAQMDPSEISGYPTIKGNKTSYVPPDIFPIDSDPIPEGKDGWLILLDEFSSASLAVQSAAYKLILDRMVGQYPLHKNVAMVAAGNKTSDKAVVNRMSTAMQSRLIHLNLIIKHKEWLDWANENGIDHRITSFIEFKPGLLHSFNPDHKDNTFASPRTWEFASKLIKDKSEITLLMTKILAGTIGEGAAREFKGFTDVYESLPKIREIMANPTTVPINTSPDVMFAITGMVSHEVTKDNIEPLMKFVERLPLEFQIITWISSIKRNKEVYGFPAIKEWVSKNGKSIMF
jgi:hypothetical protein